MAHTLYQFILCINQVTLLVVCKNCRPTTADKEVAHVHHGIANNLVECTMLLEIHTSSKQLPPKSKVLFTNKFVLVILPQVVTLHQEPNQLLATTFHDMWRPYKPQAKTINLESIKFTISSSHELKSPSYISLRIPPACLRVQYTQICEP